MSTEEIRLVLGPMTVAVILNTFLFGICFNQFVTYYNSDYRDRLPLKLFVTWELIIDTVQTAVSIYMLWLYFVENYLNPNFLATAPWPFTAIPIFTSLSSCPIQLFLSWRVLRLSKSWVLLGFLVTLSTAQTVLALITGATAVQEPMLEGGLKFIPLVDSWLGVTVATDLAISASLTFYLSRIKTGFKKSDYMITQLMRSAIETAAFATIFSITVLIVFTVIPDSTLSMVFSLPIGRIYTNTLLMTLNGRQKLRDDLSGNYESFPSRHRNATVHIKVSRDTAQDSYALGSLKAQQNAMENDHRAHTPKNEEGIAV